ncbi:MAG TPA: hypothetical protein PLF40_07795 [Kofleriaceae bacterium]|nr:hypothetical protein [Kofleriaceae bacterium]
MFATMPFQLRRTSGGLVAAAISVVVALPACGKSPNAATKAPTSAASALEPAAPRVGSASATPVAAPVTVGVPSTVPPAATSPKLTVHNLTPGALEIENQSGAAISIAWRVAIERQANGAWLDDHEMSLSDKCPLTYPEPECKTLAAGERWRPLPWTGWFGCTQCNSCDKNFPAGAGTYRFAVSVCNSSTKFLGEPIVVDSPAHFVGTPCDADCKSLQKSFSGK